VIPLAHVAGVPVEELFEPLAIALLCAGAWITARLRRPHVPIRRTDGTSSHEQR
jgi:hypothetical protein